MTDAGQTMRPSNWQLLVHQVRYQNRVFWRSPMAAFFTLVFPLMFLLVFVSVFGNGMISALGVPMAQFYAPSLGVYGAITAAYTNLAIMTVNRREEGILKRVRGTPLPPWLCISPARLASTTWTAFIAVGLLMGVGIAFFGIRPDPGTLAAALLAFLVGVGCFAALGMMLAALASDSNLAAVAGNATLLPLAFASEIFIPPSSNSPAWVAIAGDIFPVKHFAQAFSGAFNPTLSGNGFQWSAGPGEYAILSHLAVMAVWGVVAAALAVRFFKWEPTGGEGGLS